MKKVVGIMILLAVCLVVFGCINSANTGLCLTSTSLGVGLLLLTEKVCDIYDI